MNHTLFVVLKVITTLSSLCIYLSPVPSMRRILKHKSPGEMQLVPLVLLFVNCYQRMLYGISINDIFPIVFTVLIGAILAVVYVAIFTKVTSDRMYVLRICTYAGVPLILLTLYCGLAWAGLTHQTMDETGDVLGYIGVLTSVGLFMSPLMTARKVVRTKNAESIPIELCAVSFVCNTLWMLYGIAADEVFVWAPNIACVAFGLVQILLYVKYNPNKHRSEQDTTTTIAVVCVDDSKIGKADLASPRFHALRSPPLAAIGAERE